jgi:hypothetical protein
MTQRIIWLSLTGVFVALAGTQPANSFEYKIYPGSLSAAIGCWAVNFNRNASFLVHTKAGATLTVICPITRDRVPHWGRRNELTRIDAGKQRGRRLAPSFAPVSDFIEADQPPGLTG